MKAKPRKEEDPEEHKREVLKIEKQRFRVAKSQIFDLTNEEHSFAGCVGQRGRGHRGQAREDREVRAHPCAPRAYSHLEEGIHEEQMDAARSG